MTSIVEEILREKQKEMIYVYPDILLSIMKNPKHKCFHEANKHIADIITALLEYNDFTSLGLISSSNFAFAFEDASKEDKEKATMISWIMNLLFGSFIILDDIADGCDRRGGYQTWHKRNGIGREAVNDAKLLRQTALILLDSYFGNEEFYPELLDLCTNFNIISGIGQCLDSNASVGGPLEKEISWDLYKTIADYKLAKYVTIASTATFSLLGAKARKKWLSEEYVGLCDEIYYLIQVKDDFTEAYGGKEDDGDYLMVGGGSEDIVSGKLTWLYLTAIQKADSDQKAILKSLYGKVGAEDDKYEEVKRVYDELEMPRLYQDFVHRRIKEIKRESFNLDRKQGILIRVLLDFLFEKELEEIGIREEMRTQ